MILHCAPPYRQDIPNPALGYLKGFLQAKGIPVKNVYWNVILARTIFNFHRSIEKYSKEVGLSSISGITLFLWKHLFPDMKEPTQTPMDLVFSSVLMSQEISQTVDSIKTQVDQYIKQHNLHEAPISGFTLKTHQWPMSYYIISQLKKVNPDTTIVVGGICNESQGRIFMKVFDLADFAIYGEGEYPLVHLVNALKEDSSFKDVPNLLYRDGDTIVSTASHSEYPPLDTYPFADHSDYFLTFKRLLPAQMPILIPVWGSRSCPWNKCKFCVLNEEYTYRTRSPENIVEEIEYQSKKYNADSFIFVDTELPGNKKRFKTLLELLIKSSANRKKPYHFHAEISPVFIDSETAKYMQLASFTSIQIGFEAMTDRLLEKMQKRHTFAHNIQALKVGTQYNLKIGGLNIIRSIPPETAADVIESSCNVKYLRFLLNTYQLTPNFLSLFKGSPFYQEMSEADREHWKENPFWAEIAATSLVSECDRFDLFGFCPENPMHYHQWDNFERVMMSYQIQNRSYEWIEYPEGSFIEEKGPKEYRYTLDRDETDILVFCDSIKSFTELKEKFSHVDEDNLRGIVSTLKEAGMVYCDKDMHTIISVVEACNRKTF
jgi:radical SAM superfamily enzyme YgiQ (UPF0313 family)